MALYDIAPFTALPHSHQPNNPSLSAMAFDHQRIPGKEMLPVVTRSPASKKIKLSTPPAEPISDRPQLQCSTDVHMAGAVDDKGIQTTPAAVLAADMAGSAGPQQMARGSSDASQRLQSIRNTISEQFDIEILLKHRELGNIEKEIAKTQVAIEQLRRCQLVPYADSTEAQLHAQLNYKPPSSNPHHIPDYAPPPEGVVDGPYTRHYRQWLISHQRFDGPSAPSYVTPLPTPGIDVFGIHQSLADTGRPQRQSALKAQTKNGVQVCLYRKRDGTLVRLECGTCHRSNFSSAQGFINHCRIAHQTEYSSHDAAADACGKEVDEEEQASLISPMLRTAIDGPARNTRQTQQQWSPSLPTPQAGFHSRSSSFSKTPSVSKPLTPAASTQRKGGRRAAMTVNTPKTPAPQSRGSTSNSTSPMDFSTSNLESHLKRKRPDINVEGLLKEVTEKVEWSHARSRSVSLETESEDDSVPLMGAAYRSRNQPSALPAQQRTPTSMPPTPTSQEPAYRRPMSGVSSVPKNTPKSQRVSEDGDVSMDDFDASSSDDEDGGYRSDGAQGNDDDLYSVPLRRPMQGEPLEYGRNSDSPTFGPMLNSSSNSSVYSHFLQHGANGGASPLLSGFTMQTGGTALLNGGGIPQAAPPPPSVTINPAVLMRNADYSTPSPTVMNMAQITAALLDGAARGQSMEPEVPKHVRFAIPGIGGEYRHQEGVNGASS